MTQPGSETVRADVWLWAARFFKTRRLSREAVDGGKVEVNDVTCKPAKMLKPDDVVRVNRGEERFEVVVRAVASVRGPASVAQLLFEETESSKANRASAREQQRLVGRMGPPKRPDKQDRRALRRFLRESS